MSEEQSRTIELRVPDIGDIEVVDVIEVLVSPGDRVEIDDPLVTLESDKASMDVPASAAGEVVQVHVEVGAQVGEGAVLVTVSASEAPAIRGEQEAAEPDAPAASPASSPSAVSPPSQTPTAGPAPADVDFDLVVLGSGPGGYTAAFRAADLGLSVALIERYPSLGGVCLNVGCIPSKALLHAARVIDEAHHAAEIGIRYGEPEIDLDRLREWKGEVVGRLTGGLADMSRRREVTVIEGLGTLVGAHEIEVVSGGDETRRLKFAQAILAAGSQSVNLPFLPEDERIFDSTGALELRRIPDHLLVIGGGIIGLEMATVYRALGSRVSVVELLPEIMAGADKDLVRIFRKRFEPQLEHLWLDTKVAAAEALEEGIQVRFQGGDAPETAVFDAVLVAVGRSPNGRRIGAEAAGVTVDERGFIPTDAQMRSNLPHLFAIGDLTDGPMLAHKATHEGKVAAEVAAGLKSGFEARVIPSVAYTDPEVAWVGLTETEAKQKSIPYAKGQFPWAASGRALSTGRSEGVTKLLFDPESDRILGGGVIGPSAGELIAEIGLAIEMGADAQDISLTIHPHPTLSETVGLAAEAFEGTITDLYLPKKKRRPKT